MCPKHCTFPDFYPTETKALWSRKMKHRSSHVPKSWKKLRISRRLRGRSPWNQHLCFVSGGVREKVFRKSARNHLFSKNTFTRRDHETLEWCFGGFFSSRFCENVAQWIWRFARPAEKKCKKLAKSTIFWRTKTLKNSNFWVILEFYRKKKLRYFRLIFGNLFENFQTFFTFFLLEGSATFFDGQIRVFSHFGGRS